MKRVFPALFLFGALLSASAATTVFQLNDAAIIFGANTNGNATTAHHGYSPALSGSGHDVFNGVGAWVKKPVFSITDAPFNAVAGGADAGAAILAACNAASSVGGIAWIPEGTFNVSGLTLTNSNLTLAGPGTIKATTIATNFIVWTGSNNSLHGFTLDGASNVMTLIFTGNYSTNWTVTEVTFKNARVTDLNDPSNTASTGAATANGFRGTTGCKGFYFSRDRFFNISFDGTKPYLGGVGRCSRGIDFAPNTGTATTWADACTDIRISNCSFINSDDDKAKVDNDAMVFQAMDENLVPNIDVTIQNNYVRNWGWRGVKFQASGGVALGNIIYSGTTAKASVGPCMRSAIEWFGKNFTCSDNQIYGGSLEHPICAFSSGSYQCDNFAINGNTIQLDSAGSDDTFALFIRSARHGTIHGNVIGYCYNGIRFEGDCEDIDATGNYFQVCDSNPILMIVEADNTDTWFNIAPSNMKVDAVVGSTPTYVISAATGCRKIQVGTIRAASSGGLINFASDVTGMWTPTKRTKVQQADQSVTASTTLVDATDLIVPIEANKNYRFKAEIQFNEVGTVAGLRVAMAGPASPLRLISSAQVATGSATAAFQSTTAYGAIALASIGTTGTKTATVWGTVMNGANAGNLSFQFAQTTSDASAVTVKQGSTFEVEELP